MAAISNFLEDALINHILRNTSYAGSGTSIYVGLFLADPTDAYLPVECSGTSYARQNVTAWDAPSDGATANTSDITFPAAGNAWGTITHVGILDALTGGNLLLHGQLTAPKAVGNGDTFKFNAGDLDVSLA